jgi:hypothetical protein
MSTLMVRGWRRLWNSLANCNEYPKLKLPKAWEPLDSSRALPLGEAKAFLFSLFMETKLRKSKMESVRSRLGFPNMLVVDCVGWNGGLALLWSNNIDVDIQNFSQCHINESISFLGDDPP